MTVGTICSRVVVTVAPSESVLTAARRMAEHRIGTLVVVGEADSTRARGILTDRDVATRCVAARLDPALTPVAKIMSKPPYTIDECVGVEEALASMAGRAVRRLIVITKDGQFIGLLSLDDVLTLMVGENEAIGQLLARQQAGAIA
jgi:CBS domain-containing protein